MVSRAKRAKSLSNCKKYWHPFNQSRCTKRTAYGSTRKIRPAFINYPGLKNKLLGKLPRTYSNPKRRLSSKRY
jgi:hypothetical protein